jgi:hypothetical protein
MKLMAVRGFARQQELAGFLLGDEISVKSVIT